ncbi:MAG: hypothetical protein P8J37_02615 [Fuerstiella sp.]|nr:hypothetical protein [Fuerstiella sp.]
MNTVPTNRILFLWVTVFTVIFEVITCAMRFGLRLESTRDTASTIGRLTCGLRIHHSYIGGVVMLLSCWLWDQYPKASWWMLAIGLGLFFSDLIHHFLVLWPVVSSPQFDFFYPPGL